MVGCAGSPICIVHDLDPMQVHAAMTVSPLPGPLLQAGCSCQTTEDTSA